jgi:hypothetical membrane protein
VSDVKSNDDSSKYAPRHPVAMLIWNVLFLVGGISFALAVIGIGYHEGLQNFWGLAALVMPLYFGIPATLLSIVQALVFRLNRICFSVMLLLAHIAVFGLNFWIGAMACC